MSVQEGGTVRAEAFTGVFCSGLTIDDPSLLTAMCLLFDRVYVPNFVTDAIRFVGTVPPGYVKGAWKAAWKLREYDSLEIGGGIIDQESLKQLDHIAQEHGVDAVSEWIRYLVLTAATFFMRYEPLLGPIFETQFYEKGIRGGHPKIFFATAEDSRQELEARIRWGAIPVVNVGHGNTLTHAPQIQTAPSSDLASLLAINAVKLALPQTHAAHPEDILEAREKLRDHLLPFWASMLRLTAQFKEWQQSEMPEAEAAMACVEFLNTHVRPDLLELNSKLLKERRNWAFKIINPVADGVEAAVSKAQLSTAHLVAIALQTLGRIVSTVSSSAAPSATLAYLIRVKQVMGPRGQ